MKIEKSIIKTSIIFFVLFFSFFITKDVFASTLASQTVSTDIDTMGYDQTFTATKNTTITSVDIYFSGTGSYCSLQILFMGLVGQNLNWGSQVINNLSSSKTLYTMDFPDSEVVSGQTYYFRYSLMNCDSGTYYGSSVDLYDGGSWNGSNLSDTYFVMYDVEPNAPASSQITSPLDYTTAQVNNDLTISGNCIENGTNTTAFFFNGQYNFVECSSYTFSTTRNSSRVGTAVYVLRDNCQQIDNNWYCNFADDVLVEWVSSTSTSPYSIEIINPSYTGDKYFKRQASNDAEFLFRYKLPSMEMSSSTNIIIEKFDSGWQNVLEIVANNSIDYLDPELDEQFIVGGFEASSTALTYYRALMRLPNEGYKQVAVLYWYIDGSGDSSTPIADVKENDYGVWGNLLRSLFVPDRRFMKDYVDDIPDKLSQVVPFYYYYQLKGQLENLSVSASSSLVIDYQIPIEGQNLTLPFFDSGSSGVKEVADGLRPWAEYMVWILLLFYIVYRVFDFEL